MRSHAVISAEPRPKRLCSSSGALVRSRIGPFAEHGLDESFGLAIGLWAVRACAFESKRLPIGHRLKPSTAIVATVVRQDASDADPAARKPRDRALEKGRRGRSRLVGQHLDIGRATVVVDRHVGILPPDASDAGPLIAMDPMTDAGDARERFDIEVHQVARMRPFVAGDGIGRRETRQAISPARAKTAATVERGTWSWTAIAQAVRRS